MAQKMRTVTLHRELIAHDHGHWCSDCLLSTGIRAYIVLRTKDRMWVTQMVWCEDCGSRRILVEA